MKEYEKNPSLDIIEGMTHEVIKGKKFGDSRSYIDPRTSEEVVFSEVVPDEKIRDKVKINDVLKYDKIYRGLRLRDLNKPALGILDFIREKSVAGKDSVFLHVQDCMDFCGWKQTTSRASYYRGLNCLCENKILFKKKGTVNEYFINVNMIFNGNRSGIYKIVTDIHKV